MSESGEVEFSFVEVILGTFQHTVYKAHLAAHYEVLELLTVIVRLIRFRLPLLSVHSLEEPLNILFSRALVLEAFPWL